MHSRSKSIFNIFTLFALLASLIGSAVIVTPAYAATITVTSTADSGAGSLRDAITNASAGDTITFNLSYPATINLSTAIAIGKDLSIVGPGAANLILNGGAHTIFSPQNQKTVSISGLTMTNGSNIYNNGGAIYNYGYLTISNCSFTNNTAVSFGGAIYSDGSVGATLSVTNSTFTGNSAAQGGAIVGGVTISITNSTFTNNSAIGTVTIPDGEGGAIYGSATIISSTFDGNSATGYTNAGSPGGGYGGAVYGGGGLTVTDSTFHANKAQSGDNTISCSGSGCPWAGGGNGGAIYISGGSGNLISSSTFSNNSAVQGANLQYTPPTIAGALFIGTGSVINLNNSILANSSAIVDCNNAGTLSASYNLIETNGGIGHQCGSPLITSDPQLSALANNGGSTQTMALGSLSPAIDAGSCPSLLTDQRGVSRPQGAACDIGAYEFPKPEIDVRLSDATTSIPNGTGTFDFGATTLGTPTLYTFWVKNTGAANLTLTAPITLPTGFSLVSTFGSTTLAPSTSTSFQVQLDATAVGSYSGTLSFANDDSDENPYNFTISGSVGPAVFNSLPAYDGWITETSELSNKGSMPHRTWQLRAGDDGLNKQYLGIMHFNTASLPDNAIITSIKLRIKTIQVVGKPFSGHGKLIADIRKGFFGSSSALQSSDFQAPASKSSAGSFVNAGSGWYQLTLSAANFKYINLAGATQFRLRFAIDDDNEHVADYIRFFAGNATAAKQPQLIITYHLP